MISKLQVWNMALGYIGTRTIAGETERTPEAIQCNLYWDTSRRTALRSYPWRWAQRRAQLAQVPMPELYKNEWDCAYTLPDKFLRLHRVSSMGNPTYKPKWLLVAKDDGTPLILSNVENAIADFTADVTDISRWDDAFIKTMSLRLACDIAVALLKNNTGKIQELEQRYQASMPAAKDANTNDNNPPVRPDSWLVARGGGYTEEECRYGYRK